MKLAIGISIVAVNLLVIGAASVVAMGCEAGMEYSMLITHDVAEYMQACYN